MSDKEAGKLIIQNIDLIENAYALLDTDISKEVFGVINMKIKSWANDKQFVGEYNFLGDEENETYFYKSEWKMRGGEPKDKWICRFSCDCTDPDKSESLYLTHLCGFGGQRMGFVWEFNYNHFSNMKKKDLRALLISYKKRLPDKFYFNTTDNHYITEFMVKATDLAEAYAEDNIEDCLTSVDDALSTIKEAIPIFDDIVAQAKKEFKLKES